MASKVAIDKAAVLAEHFLLRHLAAEELGQLATYARMVHYPAGSTIVRKGDAGDSMLALVGGRVKICSTSPDGKELLLNIMKPGDRSEEHTSELQSLMRISYAVFCLKKKKHRYQSDSSLTSTYA